VVPAAGFGLLDHVPDGVVLCDADGRIVYANPRAARMTGYKRSELIGKPIELLVPTAQRPAHRRHRMEFQEHPRVRPMGSADHSFNVRRRNGQLFPADIQLGPLSGDGPHAVMAVIRDITPFRDLEASLAHQALHDPLTGLANRTLFFDRLGQAMVQARRNRSQVAVVMLDLDHFKGVNDAHGHQVGDIVLKRVSAQLSQGLRGTDTVARIGGDEFAWILPGVNGRQAAHVMLAKLLQAVPDRFVVNGRAIDVGVSAGMALFPDDAPDVDTLMRRADVELYAMKRQAPSQSLPHRRPRR
jgi:diguanylate cyclase (GGDEF)-like protein/PAS domain S-box-containing protein